MKYHHDFIFKDVFKVLSFQHWYLLSSRHFKFKIFFKHTICNSRCRDLQMTRYLNFKQSCYHKIIFPTKFLPFPWLFYYSELRWVTPLYRSRNRSQHPAYMPIQQEQIINHKIWKWLGGRYGDDCILMQFLLSRFFFLWDMKVTFHLCFCLPEFCKSSFFFFQFSMQILPYQAANQPSCLWSPMSLTLSRKAEFNLAAAGWKMK